MEPATYPDPFAQALGHAAQRSAQLASIVMTAGQVFAWYRAQREQEQAATDEQAARAARDQQRAAYQQGRLGWAPALDPQWLGQADLLRTARAWGAAAPFAGTDPAAASALRTCEERLRRLHPYAMAYCDRLREDGSGPIDAMRETVPLFTREPNVRPVSPRPPGVRCRVLPELALPTRVNPRMSGRSCRARGRINLRMSRPNRADARSSNNCRRRPARPGGQNSHLRNWRPSWRL